MADNFQPESVVGVFTTDADLKIKVWDNVLVRFTGVSFDEARGKQIHQLFPEIEIRGLARKLETVLKNGSVEVLAPAFHRYLIPCPPQKPSARFEHMLQRTTIAPVLEDQSVVGVLVTIEDVTARVERERELADLLSNPDPEARLSAAEALARADEIEDELNLVGAIGDTDWRVRQSAVQGLAKRSAPNAIQALLQLLKEDHNNLAVLNSALQVLSMVEVDTLPALIEFLNDSDPDLRMQAALALGEQRDLQAAPALLAALNDENINVRFHAIEALGKLGSVDAAEPLMRIAESKDFFLAFPALDALKRIGETKITPRLIPFLADESLRDPAAEALGALGDETVVEPLTKVLNDNPHSTIPIASALTALYDRFEEKLGEGDYIADLTRQSIQPSGTQNLLTAIAEAENEELRPLAVVIGWLRGPAVDRMLVRLLGEPTVRDEVLTALTHHGESVINLLIDQIQSEDIETRRAAITALGRLGYRQATAALTSVLEKDSSMRIEAARALARIGDESALDPLLRMIGDSDSAARQAVVGALNSIGSANMAERIKPLMQHDDPLVRESAAKIAGYFGYTDCAELLLQCCDDEDERVRRAAVEHLAFLEDDRVKDVLAQKLKTDVPAVRAAVVVAMSHLEGTVPNLVEALKDNDPWVRYFAAKSLGRLNDSKSIDALVEVVENEPLNHVRIAALEALGKLGGNKAVHVISGYVRSDDRDMARVAAEALEEIRLRVNEEQA